MFIVLYSYLFKRYTYSLAGPDKGSSNSGHDHRVTMFYRLEASAPQQHVLHDPVC